MKADLSVIMAGITLKNPVMTCSGTFGSGKEYDEIIGGIEKLGGITTKGVSNFPWKGNNSPRICETPSGMLNAVGLENAGMRHFRTHDLPFLLNKDTCVFVNVCGHSIDEYKEVVSYLNDTDIDAYEINISCPNVKSGGISFGTDPKGVEHITDEIKKVSKKPVFMKLTPNVTDIREIARAAEAGGADGISLINTLTGMKIDVEKQTFVLANHTGGLSGPAIHPVAVRMVYECFDAVSLPIIGMGGISTWQDAVEMMLAGADAVSVGTETFNDPFAAVKIVDGIEDYLERHKIKSVRDLKGKAHAEYF